MEKPECAVCRKPYGYGAYDPDEDGVCEKCVTYMFRNWGVYESAIIVQYVRAGNELPEFDNWERRRRFITEETPEDIRKRAEKALVGEML